jgi:hypothetical protein
MTKKFLLDMVIKSKNMAKIFLGGGHVTKIRTKLYIYIYIYILLLSIFFLIWGGGGGGTMAHPGRPLPPSLSTDL